MSRLARIHLALDRCSRSRSGRSPRACLAGDVDGPRASSHALFCSSAALIVRAAAALVPIAAVVTAVVVQALATERAGGCGFSPAPRCRALFGSRLREPPQARSDLRWSRSAAVVHDVKRPSGAHRASRSGRCVLHLALLPSGSAACCPSAARNSRLERQRTSSEQPQQAYGRRARIARELHDVIPTNSASRSCKRGGDRILGTQTERARRASAPNQQSGREALTEAAPVASDLREGDDRGRWCPAGPRDLDSLLDGVPRAGLNGGAEIDRLGADAPARG